METTTGALVRRLQQGDESALEPFIRATKDQAFRLAFSLLGDRHLSEDVLQDVYVTVYQKIGQLREPEAFRGWFGRILVNRCKRVLKTRRADSLEELSARGQEPSVDPGAGLQDRLHVRQAFARLAEHDREVLTLREVLQFSYDEIATSLRLPLSTVRNRLSAARRRLLEALTKGGR